MTNSYIHLKGLNGIRAIAAMAVVLSHINIGLGRFNLPVVRSLDLAAHGVTIFFSLSGFLITYLLLHEKEKHEININKFYIRRVLRIWPLYFLYLFISIFVAYLTGIYNEGSKFSLIFYVFLTANIPMIFGLSLPLVAHLWSIGVEEQFYLFWPWLIKKNQKMLKAVFIFSICFFIVRVLCWFIDYNWGNPYPYIAIHITRFDCMAIGSLGAILFFEKNEIFRKLVYLKVVQVIAWFVILLVTLNKFHIASIIDPEILSLVTVVLIVNVCNNPKTLINLDNPIFNFLGKISYGIYVIHQLIIYLYAQFLNKLHLHTYFKYFLIYFGVLSSTILIAYISYEYFEKKFIKLKDKFTIIKSSNVQNIAV